jgi:hypothetical protein
MRGGAMMSSDRPFPTTTPRWLTEVRTYWAALTAERKYRRNDRSTEDDSAEETKSSEPRESREA